jgi:hypothetical protein
MQLPTMRRAWAAVGPNHSKPHSVQLTLAFSSVIDTTIDSYGDPPMEHSSSFGQLG